MSETRSKLIHTFGALAELGQEVANRTDFHETMRTSLHLLLGSLAGLIGAAGATALGYALAEHVFNIPFSANPLVWIYGIVGGALAVTLAGWIGTRATVNEPPLAVLRQLA